MAAALLVLVSASAPWARAAVPDEARGVLAAAFVQAETAKASAVRGGDGWCFLARELRSYSRGEFWGDAAVAAASCEKNQDPLPAILEFHDQLATQGITLIVVPVPGKVAVYGDELDPRLPSSKRWDEPQRRFCEVLAGRGVTTIDLQPELAALRASGTDAYCRSDSHWSPAAVRVAAKAIAALVSPQPWFAGVPKKAVTATAGTIAAHGDLAQLLGDETATETLAVETVKLDGADVESDAKSPLLLMGDSHTLVFSRDLLTSHAGLPDLLAGELGFAPDLVGVKGSGANGSRMILARRKDNLAGKRCVVWCFTCREFTESIQGWQRIPVIRP